LAVGAGTAAKCDWF